MATTDAVTKYFDALAARGHEPRLKKTTGTLRFELVDGGRTERWLLTVKGGDLTVSRGSQAADMVVRLDRDLFERLIRGKANAMAAFLRGAVALEGRPELIVQFQRLLPRPRDARTLDRPAGYARRQQ